MIMNILYTYNNNNNSNVKELHISFLITVCDYTFFRKKKIMYDLIFFKFNIFSIRNKKF